MTVESFTSTLVGLLFLIPLGWSIGRNKKKIRKLFALFEEEELKKKEWMDKLQDLKQNE